eukprot:2071067-Amphidinium_carterae.1
MAPPPRSVDNVKGLSSKCNAFLAWSNMETKVAWPPFNNGADAASAPTSARSNSITKTSDTKTDCNLEERVEVFECVIATVRESENPAMSEGSTKWPRLRALISPGRRRATKPRRIATLKR